MNDLTKFHDKQIEKGDFDPITELSDHGFSRSGKKPSWIYKNHRKWTEDEITENIIKELGQDVARPLGYKVLVKSYEAPSYMAEERIDSETALQNKGLVLDMGEEAFSNGSHSRFPKGSRVAIGDWVIFRCYERQLQTLYDEDHQPLAHFGIIDDDKVDMVIKDPHQVSTYKI